MGTKSSARCQKGLVISNGSRAKRYSELCSRDHHSSFNLATRRGGVKKILGFFVIFACGFLGQFSVDYSPV